MRRWTTLVCAGTGTAAGMLLAVILLQPSLLDDPAPPDDVRVLADWVAGHPADWRSARELSERALDSDLPNRVELWKAAYDHAERLAPLRSQAEIAFVRGGLFHWEELSAADRQSVLAAVAPLLGDPATFESLHRNLWKLTRDFEYLRKAAPDTPSALRQLRDLALANGLFEDYRELRGLVRSRTLEVVRSRMSSATVPELLALVPDRADQADVPVLREILDALARHPVDSRGDERIGRLLSAALDLGIEPPDALAALLEATWIDPATRARLALALGNDQAAKRLELAVGGATTREWSAYFAQRALFEARRGDRAQAAEALALAVRERADTSSTALAARVHRLLGDQARATVFEQRLAAASSPESWSGRCGTDLCRSITRFALLDRTPRALRLEVVQSDEIPPYVEILVDGAIVAEGTVEETRSFVVATQPGIHELEVRLVNERTRSGAQRRVRLS